MKRVAFKMKLKPGCKQEYEKRHDEIWPELSAELKKAGIYDYSIFLDHDTGILFAVQKLSDNHMVEALPGQPVMRRWWDFMADIMETHPDHSPVVIELKEVFHMD